MLLIFLEKYDFLKLTMQGFKSDKNDFLKMVFGFLLGFSSPYLFLKSLYNQVDCVGFLQWSIGVGLRFLRAGYTEFYGMMSTVFG